MSDYVPLTFMYCSEYMSWIERKSDTNGESEAGCNSSLIQSQLSLASKRNCILHGELLTNLIKNLNSFRRFSSRNKRDWVVYLSAILTQESYIVRFFAQPMPINVFRNFNFLLSVPNPMIYLMFSKLFLCDPNPIQLRFFKSYLSDPNPMIYLIISCSLNCSSPTLTQFTSIVRFFNTTIYATTIDCNSIFLSSWTLTQ